jgi:hypothetical protein
LDGRPFVTILHVLVDIELRSRNQTGNLKPEAIANLHAAAAELIAQLAAMDLPISKKTVEEMLLGAKTHVALNAAIKQIYNNIALEMDGRKFYGPLRKYEQYYEQPKLFGDDVFTKFRSANNDISEAGSLASTPCSSRCRDRTSR